MLSILAPLLIAISQQDPAEKVYQAATPSIVTLSVERPGGQQVTGTAFLSVQKGIAVTAWHVVNGAQTIKAKFSDGHEVKVNGLVDKDQDLDIALLSIESGDRPLLTIADATPRVGTKAYVIGSPKGMDFSISDGIISQTPLFGQDMLYQFTCPVSQGNSGGPLLNSDGQVLGVVSWQLRDAQNLNFAIPSRSLIRLDQAKAVAPFVMDTSASNDSSELLFAVTDELISDALGQMNLSSSQSDDGTGKTAFLFDSEGTKISLFQYAKEQGSGATVNLSLSTGYQSVGNADLEKLNHFNRSHRFARSYRDANGVVYLENDLDIESGLGKGALLRFVSDFTKVVGQFEREALGRNVVSRTQEIEFIAKNTAKGTISSIDDQTVAKLLKECGYESELDANNHVTTFKVGQTEVTLCNLSPAAKGSSASMSLTVGFSVAGKTGLADVNSFNEQTRYSKVFLDEEGDPILVSDLALGDGVTELTVKTFIKTFLKTLPSFETLVRNR